MHHGQSKGKKRNTQKVCKKQVKFSKTWGNNNFRETGGNLFFVFYTEPGPGVSYPLKPSLIGRDYNATKNVMNQEAIEPHLRYPATFTLNPIW